MESPPFKINHFSLVETLTRPVVSRGVPVGPGRFHGFHLGPGGSRWTHLGPGASRCDHLGPGASRCVARRAVFGAPACVSRMRSVPRAPQRAASGGFNEEGPRHGGGCAGGGGTARGVAGGRGHSGEWKRPSLFGGEGPPLQIFKYPQYIDYNIYKYKTNVQ